MRRISPLNPLKATGYDQLRVHLTVESPIIGRRNTYIEFYKFIYQEYDISRSVERENTVYKVLLAELAHR